MVKKFIVILCLLVYTKAASSQVLIALLFGDKLNNGKLEFGLMAGPTLSNLSNVDGKSKPGIDLGLYFNIQVNDRLYLHPEAIPKLSFGEKSLSPYPTGDATLDSLYANGSVKRIVNAIGLPLLVRYRIAGSFFAEGGAQIDLITKTKDVFETDVNENNLTYENKTKDNYTRFDAGYVLGLAYKIKPGVQGMTLGLRYYGGLTDIIKPEAGKQLNSAWFFNVYIPIGAGKAAKKQAGNAQ